MVACLRQGKDLLRESFTLQPRCVRTTWLTPLAQATRALIALRTDLDAEILSLSNRLPKLTCHRGCRDCCEDDLTVFEIEAELCLRYHSELLDHGIPAPKGRCAFLGSADECRIYAERPYVCRTQGLPLRWYEETETGEILEEHATCRQNSIESVAPSALERHTQVHLPTLRDSDFWLIGPYEERLSVIQGNLDHEQYFRVPLRALFSKQEQ